MKKIILLTLFLVLLMISPSWAPGITDLEGITGLIGKEDVNWGTGLSTDTFSVTTYDGGSATLTKLPNLDANGYSRIKNVWYPNNAATVTDHGIASGANYIAGNLKKVIDLISGSMTIELPGNTTYIIGTNLTIPSNINLRFQKGAILSVSGGITLTLNCHVEAGNYQIISGTGTVAGALVNAAKQNEWISGPADTSTVGGTIKILNAITTVSTIGTITSLGTITTLNNITPTNAQGDLYYRDGTKIENLPAGIKGKALTTGGPAADPSWEGMTTQGDIEYHNGTTRTRLPAGTIGYALNTQGPGVNPIWLPQASSCFLSYSKSLYGDGSDGDVVISVNTTLAAGTSGVKVMQYNNLTINTGIYLEGHSSDKVLVILVKGTLTLNGTIRMNGRGGAGGTNCSAGEVGAFGGGGAGGSTSYGGGAGGGGGQPGANGAGGTGGFGGGKRWTDGTTVISLPFVLGFGSGGNAGNAGAAGSNGTKTASSPLTPIIFEIAKYLYGGGGGSTEGSVYGGAGGGVVWIEALNIIWGASGIASSNAGDPTGTYGSAGGAGGFVQIAYKTKTGSSTLQTTGTNGKSGGSGYGTGGNGAAGLTGEFQVQ